MPPLLPPAAALNQLVNNISSGQKPVLSALAVLTDDRLLGQSTGTLACELQMGQGERLQLKGQPSHHGHSPPALILTGLQQQDTPQAV